MSLTQEQRNAVEQPSNLLLTACPGSGKTRTIIAKLVREIEGVRDTPRCVACLTYTNTAVQEIEQRVAAFLQPGDERHFTVATIHSFCLNAILRPFAWRLRGFRGMYKVLSRDTPEFENIVAYAAAQIGSPRLDDQDFEDFASINRDAGGELVGMALRNDIVRRGAPHFHARCEQLGFIDFSTIIYRSYCLLRDHPDIARSLSARYAWILVDEFQDTTELQIEILKLIYGAGRSHFFTVGDPAQSIYVFTGARPELALPFAAEINARTDLSLTGNYRCSPPIIRHAERLFPRHPPMVSAGEARVYTEEPQYIGSGTTFATLSEEFLPRLAGLGIPFGEATILAKDWWTLRPIGRAMRELGVPVVGPGARPYRRSRLFATLAEQLCGAVTDIRPESMRGLERALFMAVQDATAVSRPEIFSYDGRIVIIRLLRQAKRLAGEGGAAEWLDSMSAATGEILRAAELINASESGLFYASAQEMKADMVRSKTDIANLSIEDLGLFASPSRALRLSTIHYAKGREYQAVALVNLRDGAIPDYRSEDIEDDKRLFYVGVTRAKRLLFYVYEPRHWRDTPSRFLGEDGVGVI